jgi:hypothetical protein
MVHLSDEPTIYMAYTAFSKTQLSALQSVLDAGDAANFQSVVEEYGLHASYATDMGRLMLAAELEGNGQAQKADPDLELFHVCNRKDDLRCQVGQVLSNLKSRSKGSGRDSKLSESYHAFRRNAKATVLIVDKSGLDIGEPDKEGMISIKGIESRHALDLSVFSRNNAHRGLPLCDEYFYANELIPKSSIYGSGFFIDHDKVVTAAHVLMEAFKRGASPQNLLFIRGHYVYKTDASKIKVQQSRGEQPSEIKVQPNQLYLLDEPEIVVSEQMRDSDQRGDMAWVKAKPYFKGETYPFMWNGIAPKLEMESMAIYALGHGLGVPMKLSFGGRIQDITYNGTPAMFTCDMNILPGSSGSPIFDANTHHLLGIVSGLHEIYTSAVPKGDCVKLIINMGGKFSGVATHIAPFSSL